MAPGERFKELEGMLGKGRGTTVFANLSRYPTDSGNTTADQLLASSKSGAGLLCLSHLHSGRATYRIAAP